MSGINVGRWLAGGIAAGVVVWLLEGAASMLYMDDMEAALAAHNLSIELSAGIVVLTIIISLIVGLTLVFFYAAARPRFGAGPKTAIIVAVALFIGSYLLSLIGYYMLGLYPVGMLTMWALVGLVELIIASLVGGWIYKEPQQATF